MIDIQDHIRNRGALNLFDRMAPKTITYKIANPYLPAEYTRKLDALADFLYPPLDCSQEFRDAAEAGKKVIYRVTPKFENGWIVI